MELKIPFKGKLLKDGSIIDNNVEGFIILKKIFEYEHSFRTTGKIKYSKSLSIDITTLFIDPNPPKFELVFDKPIIENDKEIPRLPIVFTSIDDDTKSASFEGGIS